MNVVLRYTIVIISIETFVKPWIEIPWFVAMNVGHLIKRKMETEILTHCSITTTERKQINHKRSQ